MKLDLRTTQDLNNPNIKECPYCGCDTFLYNQRMIGVGVVYVRYDGDEAENGDMHEGISYEKIGKFAYCAKCGKRVLRFKD